MSEWPKMAGPWNLGLKVRDLGAELAFLGACGATHIEQGKIPAPSGDQTFGMAFLGTQRLLLFPRVIYEDALPEPLHHGLTHAVFEVDRLDSVLEACRTRGIAPLWGPELLSTPFGRRRLVFFRSPSGFIFETFETLR